MTTCPNTPLPAGYYRGPPGLPVMYTGPGLTYYTSGDPGRVSGGEQAEVILNDIARSKPTNFALPSDAPGIIRDASGAITFSLVRYRSGEGAAAYSALSSGVVAGSAQDYELQTAIENGASGIAQYRQKYNTLATIKGQCTGNCPTNTIMPVGSDLISGEQPVKSSPAVTVPATSDAIGDFLTGITGKVSVVTDIAKSNWKGIALFAGAAAAVIILAPYLMGGRTPPRTRRTKT
jgi:hypothetical protein